MKILALIQSKISGKVYQIMNMSRIVFGESRWSLGGAKGSRSDFDEIWAIYLNLHEKNNEIGQNSLGVHVKGA